MAQLVHRLRRSGAGLATAGLGLLYPPRCACCDAEMLPAGDDLLLCDDCRLLMGPDLWRGCTFCGAIGATDGRSPGRCGLCRKTPLKLDITIPLGAYLDDLREVVLRMKRPSHDGLSAAMGRLLALRRGRQLAELRADLIVPVPMYWIRQLGRGTNSAEILARSLGQSLGIPVGRRVLRRRRNTLPQADLSPRERFRNVRGAFAVRAGYHLESARVLLVDDILTTGATCSEAAGMLKQAGAIVVAAAVLARAQGPGST